MNKLELQKKKKQILVIAGAIAVLVLFAILLKSNRQKPIVNNTNPWEQVSQEDAWKEKWMVEANTKIKEQEEKITALSKQQEQTQKTLQQILVMLQNLKKEQVKEEKKTKESQKQQNQEVPKVPTNPPQNLAISQKSLYIPPPRNFKPTVVSDVIGLYKSKEQNSATTATPKTQQQEQTQKVDIVIPPGTFVPAVLLSGVDAPTINKGVASEYPVLLEIIDKAFLPNNWREDIKKCFAVGWATGDLASERAYIRIDRMSCISQNGTIYVAEGNNFAAVYGEDGKVGLLGRVVAKEGTLLARTLIAGFLQGVSKILQQSSTIVNFSPVGGTTTSTINPNQAVKVSLFGGASQAAELLAEEYKKLINLTFPVVEINAGRKVDIVFYQMPTFKKLEWNKKQKSF